MEVSELIKLLQTMPQDGIIIVRGCYGSEGDIDTIQLSNDVTKNNTTGKLVSVVNIDTDLCSG